MNELICFLIPCIVFGFLWTHAAYQRDVVIDALAAERKRSQEKSEVIKSLYAFANEGTDEARAKFQSAVDRAVEGAVSG